MSALGCSTIGTLPGTLPGTRARTTTSSSSLSVAGGVGARCPSTRFIADRLVGDSPTIGREVKPSCLDGDAREGLKSSGAWARCRLEGDRHDFVGVEGSSAVMETHRLLDERAWRGRVADMV